MAMMSLLYQYTHLDRQQLKAALDLQFYRQK